MKRSDVWFFGTIILIMVYVIGSVTFDYEMHRLTILWWLFLLPYVPIKMFFPNSKLFKWLNSYI